MKTKLCGFYFKNRDCSYLVILVRVSIALTKHHDQKAHWGGRVSLSLSGHNPSLEEVRIGTQAELEPEGVRSWRDAANWLARSWFAKTAFL